MTTSPSIIPNAEKYTVGVSGGMYMGKGRGINETAEKLGSMAISGRGAAKQIHPPPMKAGAANGRSDLFAGRSQGYSSKVAG